MSRNSYDGLCGICGEKMEILDGKRPICQDCIVFGVESVEIASGLPRELNWQKVPKFVIDKVLHRAYRTFLICQFREPRDEEDMIDHLGTCFRCRVYTRELARRLPNITWWHSYPERNSK